MQSTPSALSEWTNVQYNRHMTREPTVDVNRIKQEIARKGLKPGEIAQYSGVKYDTLYKILNTNRPRTSAEFVAKLAAYFGCSMEYLMGLTDKRDPVVLAVPESVEHLVDLARNLPSRKQRDLAMIARAYMDMYAQRDPDSLQEEILDLVEEYGGVEARDQLIRFLEENRNRWLLEDGEVPE
jgi:plasmid maintenance system antidote protein VapI